MFRKWVLAAFMGLFSASVCGNECDHTHAKTNNDLVPIGRFILSPCQENDCFAFSLLGEAGVRNFRVNGTAGAWITEQSRFKLSAEYLVQKLSWNFSSGKTSQWVQQGAFGADWQWLIDCGCFQALDFQTQYSYAPSKHLTPRECSDGGSVHRRIAGGRAYGGSVGSVLLLSENSRLDVSVDYDYVTYRRKYNHDKKVSGLGASFAYIARLPCCLDFQLEAQFRRPFNYYETKLTWPQAFNSKGSALSLFAGWTRGKSRLPNAFAAGIELAYAFGADCCERASDACCPLVWDPCDLNGWVRTPAVYMPEVLAIADELREACTGPTSTSIADQEIQSFPNPEYTLDVAALGNFTSNGGGALIYSIQGLPTGSSLNPTTGVINGVNTNLTVQPITYVVTVTGTNNCSSTSQTFNLIFLPLTAQAESVE